MKETERKRVLDNSHIDALEEMLWDMKYGSVTLIIQDGKIIQIEKTEKRRLKD